MCPFSYKRNRTISCQSIAIVKMLGSILGMKPIKDRVTDKGSVTSTGKVALIQSTLNSVTPNQHTVFRIAVKARAIQRRMSNFRLNWLIERCDMVDLWASVNEGILCMLATEINNKLSQNDKLLKKNKNTLMWQLRTKSGGFLQFTLRCLMTDLSE